MGNYTLINADFVEWIKAYNPDESGYFHALFADPPYSLIENSKRFSDPNAAPVKFGTDGAFQRQAKGFMGQTWDGFATLLDYQLWVTSWAKELPRICYPGAVVGLFGGSRTFARLQVGLEDAGLEVFDVVMWVYGTGLPKSHNVGKAIDKKLGAKKGEPSTAEGERWAGHGTLLKPGYEPLVLARVPRGGRSFAGCALEYQTGAINIDGARVGSATGDDNARFPSNVVFTHSPDCREIVSETNPELNGIACAPDCPVYQLNQKSGVTKAGGKIQKRSAKRADHGGAGFHFGAGVYNKGYEDEGGASRFFWSGKAGTWERSLAGYLSPTDELTADEVHYFREHAPAPFMGDEAAADISNNIYRAGDLSLELHKYCIPARATHPTVKPIELTTYMARMVSPPPGGAAPQRILIPFAGIASEMIGALLAGWDEVVGVELTPAYIPQAQARLEWWSKFKSYQSAQSVYNQNRKEQNKQREQRKQESVNGVIAPTLF